MIAKIENPLGEIVVSNALVADLVGTAVGDCYGIVGMAFRNTTDGLVNLLKKEALSKGIRVVSQKNRMIIDIHIIVEYGVNIPVICENLIENVKFSVEAATGFQVEKINVYVEGIRIEE